MIPYVQCLSLILIELIHIHNQAFTSITHFPNSPPPSGIAISSLPTGTGTVH